MIRRYIRRIVREEIATALDERRTRPTIRVENADCLSDIRAHALGTAEFHPAAANEGRKWCLELAITWSSQHREFDPGQVISLASAFRDYICEEPDLKARAPRYAALERAVRSAGLFDNATDIVDTARRYSRFVIGHSAELGASQAAAAFNQSVDRSARI